MSAELASVGAVTDLALEQSAMLSYLGRTDQISSGWVERILAAQRADGGWGEFDGPSTWHMTMLAVWSLADLSGLGAGVPMTRVS